jgi:hypothetical protein
MAPNGREKQRETGQPGPVGRAGRASAVVPATDSYLSVACIELDRARRAGLGPCGERRRGCPPARGCSLAPCGSAPFETHRGNHLCGSRCSERYQPIGGCPRRIRPALWFRVRCCLRATDLGRSARSPSRFGPECVAAAVTDRVAGQRSKNQVKSILLRCCGTSWEEGIWTAGAGSATHRHFLDTGGRGASGIAIALTE